MRSATPPGQPVKRISTRRPYDDPGVERVYYRIIPEQGTIVDKTHMPFALNKQRISNWKSGLLKRITPLLSYLATSQKLQLTR